MLEIKIDGDQVNIEALATEEELRILKSIADELCGNCKEGAE